MASYRKDLVTDRLYFEETPFELLMQNRIIEILLVCSNYDRFILEEDGRIEEELFQEYVALGLRYPPRFTFAATVDAAFALLESRSFNLVITMLQVDGIHAVEFGRKLKKRFPEKPVVVLSRFLHDLSLDLGDDNLPHIRYVFHWPGSSNILLAIVKLLEDSMNIEQDARVVGVQAIILVEDSVRYYSSYLPIIYRLLFEQARDLMQEGLNEHQQTRRMRGRPKILLATTYEQALSLYGRYRGSLLGIITDVSYQRAGRIDPRAGLELCRHIRTRDPELPILLQSANLEHAKYADTCHAAFIHKHSKTLLNDLRTYIRHNFGFGDFVFVLPDTRQQIDRASNIVDLQHKIQTVPAACLEYHARNHHFSTWLKARAHYTLANILRHQTVDEFDDIESVREYLVDTIKNFRLHVGRGVIGHFDRNTFDESSVFLRIGDGSLGGKGRGIAFINTFLKHARIMFKYSAVAIQIPKTVVLTTEVFDRFMESNFLFRFALEDWADEEILQRFLVAELPAEIEEDLAALVSVIRRPLAVRSSSALEDSCVQPFAGVYSTYFTPNSSPDVNVRRRDLSMAIKGVYASTYFRDSKSYASATQNLIEEEKMAVIIQEVTGTQYGQLYYPNISGVARSLNVYPIENERPEEGIANIALGLGKTVVEGHTSLRFSPAYPKKVFQLSDTSLALRTTQRKFYAIDLTPDSFQVTTDPSYNLRHLEIKEAAAHRANARLMSTYDVQSDAIRDDPGLGGPKLVTFTSVLKHDTYPLAPIIKDLIRVGSREMNMPVEIEFACNLDVPKDAPRAFKFLQIRPIVDTQEFESLSLDDIEPDQALITASMALGHGLYGDLQDLIYVKPATFDLGSTPEIARRIEVINRRLREEKRHYILIGPGRWGSSDPWLGIPVKWGHITHARVIVEASLERLKVDASQGSHFFQNITAFHVAYITINPAIGEGSYDTAFLDLQPALHEDDFLRHLRFDKPLLVKIDGRCLDRQLKAVVLKPGVAPS